MLGAHPARRPMKVRHTELVDGHEQRKLPGLQANAAEPGVVA